MEKEYWKERIKDVFNLHWAERRGFALLLVVLVLIAAGRVIYLQWLRPSLAVDLAPLQTEMQAWLAERKAASTKADTIAVQLVPFDPNTVDRAQWRTLGLSDKQVDGIERYKAKGGQFRVKRDLGKMYSIRPEQFEALEPFILLPDSFTRKTYPERKPRTYADRYPAKTDEQERPAFKPFVRTKVEVNTADTITLVALPGIGPAFARGIVKYRDLLGGFVSLEQLNEVYVLKDKPDAVLRLKELLVVDSLMVRRIPINTCTVEELAAHPYLRWKLAKPLIAYRTHHGPFKTVADIRGCTLIDEEVFRKLAPYLSVE